VQRSIPFQVLYIDIPVAVLDEKAEKREVAVRSCSMDSCVACSIGGFRS